MSYSGSGGRRPKFDPPFKVRKGGGCITRPIAWIIAILFLLSQCSGCARVNPGSVGPVLNGAGYRVPAWPDAWSAGEIEYKPGPRR